MSTCDHICRECGGVMNCQHCRPEQLPTDRFRIMQLEQPSVVAKVEFYDGTGNEDEARDGAAPIACVLLDHVPRSGDQIWLKPFGHYVVQRVEYEVDSRSFNCGVRDICIWLKPEDGYEPDYSSLK